MWIHCCGANISFKVAELRLWTAEKNVNAEIQKCSCGASFLGKVADMQVLKSFFFKLWNFDWGHKKICACARL
jgi:hypothetical protein